MCKTELFHFLNLDCVLKGDGTLSGAAHASLLLDNCTFLHTSNLLEILFERLGHLRHRRFLWEIKICLFHYFSL